MRETGEKTDFNVPKTLEQAYYRHIYEEAYGGTARTIPHFWMPRFVDSDDASARTLDIYNDISK